MSGTMRAKSEEDSDLTKTKRCIFLPSAYPSGKVSIMAGAVFQIETKDFSLPGGLGRLLGGRSLPGE